MELSVTQENFARALTIVGRIASNRAGLPILSNVLLRTEGNRLLVATTNLEIAATCYIGAKIVKPGEMTLPAKLISEFIASLPRGTVDIVSKGASMTITSGNYSSIIQQISQELMPANFQNYHRLMKIRLLLILSPFLTSSKRLIRRLLLLAMIHRAQY